MAKAVAQRDAVQMAQDVVQGIRQEVKWGNPGALGLAAFGFNTILLQIHNLGIISNVEPLIYGFFWGG